MEASQCDVVICRYTRSAKDGPGMLKAYPEGVEGVVQLGDILDDSLYVRQDLS